MLRLVISVISISCLLFACSVLPTVPEYVGQTNALETEVVLFIGDGYQRKDYYPLSKKISNHAKLAEMVEGLPNDCRLSAEALDRLMGSTFGDWPYDYWRKAYAEYDVSQRNCEKSIGVKPSRRWVPPNLPTRKALQDYWATHPRQY